MSRDKDPKKEKKNKLAKSGPTLDAKKWKKEIEKKKERKKEEENEN